MRRVSYSPTAAPVIESLSPADRAEYEAIEAFLSEFPFPIPGSALVRPLTVLGQPGFVYFDRRFRYRIVYQADDEVVRVAALVTD